MKYALLLAALLFSGAAAFAGEVTCTNNSNSDYYIVLEIENGVPTSAAIGNQDWSMIGPVQPLAIMGGGQYSVVTPAQGALGLAQGTVLSIPAKIGAGEAGSFLCDGYAYSCP